MTRDARFYFANLGADVARCLRAAEDGNEKRYADSLDRAYGTLNYLRNRPEAREEGLLLLRGLAFVKNDSVLRQNFSQVLDQLIAQIQFV